MAHKPRRILRARTLIYPLLLVAVSTGLAFALSTKYGFDARIIRGKGAPFTTVDRGLISNTFNLRLVNRTDAPQTYTITVRQPISVKLEVIDESRLALQPGETTMVPLSLRFPSSLTFGDGNEPISLSVSDTAQHQHDVDFRLVGPRQ